MVLLHEKFLPSPAPELGNYRVATHELGHALDYTLEGLSGVPGFGAAHRQTVDSLYEADLAKLAALGEGTETEKVFTSDRADDDVREYFAEAVEAYLTPANDNGGDFFRAGNSKEGLLEKNPALFQYVETIMASEFPADARPRSRPKIADAHWHPRSGPRSGIESPDGLLGWKLCFTRLAATVSLSTVTMVRRKEAVLESIPKKRVTFEEYRAWPSDERWEILDGKPYAMSGASVLHQALCTDLCVTLALHFKGSPCRVFVAPLDVKFSEFDVVQPDLLVVCDKSQLKGTHAEGPPALVMFNRFSLKRPP